MEPEQSNSTEVDLTKIEKSKFRMSIKEIKTGKNYKNITREAVDKLKPLLAKYDQRKPILIDGRVGHEGEIIGGNHQFVAIQELISENKWKHGNRVWVDVIVPSNDKEAKVLSLIDNAQYDVPTSEQLAEYGADLLDFELIENIPLIADYETITLKDAYEEVAPDTEVVEDEAPEVSQEEPKSKIGEVYQLGRHRLMCGDSTKIEDVEKLMNGQKADMVFTDPPYLMGFEGNVHADGSKSFNASFGSIANDKMSKEDGEEFLYNIFSIITLFCEGSYYVCFYRLGLDNIFKAMDRHELEYKSLIIWNKGNHTLSNSDYMSKYEPIVYGWTRKHEFYAKSEFDIWDISRTAKNDLHPTMKPVELCARAVGNSSKQDGSVLDLFGGSGSTLIACEQLNRTCYMMELDPKYCDVIRKRYSKFIGKEEEWEQVTPAVHEI